MKEEMNKKLDGVKTKAQELFKDAKVKERLDKLKQKIPMEKLDGVKTSSQEYLNKSGINERIEKLNLWNHFTKRNIGIAVAVLILIIWIGSCGSSTPTGYDSNVQAFVIETFRNEGRDQFAMNMCGDNYKWLVADVAKSDRFKDALEKIDKRIAEVSVTLSDITIDKVDDKVHKSWNSAVVTLEYDNGKKSRNIKFTAQYSSDGNLVIEMR